MWLMGAMKKILGDFIDGLPDQLLGFWTDLTILLPILRGLTVESGLCTPPLPWLSRFQGAITQYIPKMTSVPLCLSTALSSPSFLSRSWQNVPFSPGLGTWTWKSKTASVKHLHESLTWKVHMIAPPAADLRLPCDSTGPHQQKSHPMKYEREKPPGS